MGLGMVHDFIRSNGYDFEVTTINSRWQKATDKSGHKIWYIGTDHGDGLLTFTFGDFREPDKRFVFTSKESLSEADEKKLKKFNEKVEKDKSLKQELTKAVVQGLWADWHREFGERGDWQSDYLEKKNIPRPPGVLVRHSTEDNQKILVVPMRTPDNEIWNIQQIHAGGHKTFHPGARVKGAFYTFGTEITTPILIGEGFATCAAAHLSTGMTVLCAFNISNLEEGIRSLIERGVPAGHIVMLADWDGATFKKTGKNPGMLAVQKLTKKYKVGAALPILAHMKDTCDENVDFADLLHAETPDLIKKMIGRVWFHADLAAEVFEKKSDDVSNFEIGEMKELIPPGETIGKAIVTEVDTEKKIVTLEVSARETLQVKRLGAPWVPKKFEIATRNSGFHQTTIKKGGGVDYEPIYTDLRLAFEELHPIVTHKESEVVYRFDGRRYQMIPRIEMATFAEKMFDPSPGNSDVNEFIGCVTRHNVKGDDFFSTEKKINFQNGWLDLTTMEFRPHSPDVGFKNTLDYEFNPEATCPEFDAFLERVLCGDKVLCNIVMEYLGYVLSGDECWTAKALVLKGEGSNGKSTFLKVARALIGKSNVLAAKIGEFKSEYYRQQLDGKLACISEETPRDALLESSYFKDIVAGGTIGARAPYGVPYSLDVRAKLIFSCNDMPPSGDTSPALLRRLLIVPFNAVFTDQTADPFIAERLVKELPGIFVKAISAYFALLQRRRFQDSETVDRELQAYKSASNPVVSFIEDKILVHSVDSDKGQVISSIAGLYGLFKMHCDASGFKQMNIVNFSKALARAVPDIEERRGMFGKKDDRFRGLRAVTDRRGNAILDAERLGLGL